MNDDNIKLVVKDGRFNMGNSAYDLNEVFSMAKTEFRRPHIQQLVHRGVLGIVCDEIKSKGEPKKKVKKKKNDEGSKESSGDEKAEKQKIKDDLTKKEQKKELKKYGVKKIPKYEDERVDLIYKLRKEKG